MKARMLIGAAAVGVVAAASLGGPRDSVTVTNQPSDIPNTLGSGTISTPTAYVARFARIQGTLTRVTAGNTFVSEALVEIFPNGTTTTRQVFSTSAIANFTGSASVDMFVRFSQPMQTTAGTSIGFATFEAYDDGAGLDSRWDTLTVTLNDGPPTLGNGLIANFGPLDGRLQYTVGVSAGSLRWFKFELNRDVNTASGTFLDIDTEGSNVSANGTVSNDTEIALYNEDGIVVGYDDDDGSIAMSQLSYGAGTRPGSGGLAYDGRDGSLPAGAYYLLVRGFGVGYPAVGWSFDNTGSPQAGFINVNIRTNAGQSAFCPADYNKSGIVSVQDVFDFLTEWFGGCL